MPKCLVVFCKNRKGETKGINFYSLTRERYDSWMNALGRDPLSSKVVLNINAVCSDHFSEDSFLYVGGRKVLKQTAVPTLKLKPENYYFPTKQLEIGSTLSERDTMVPVKEELTETSAEDSEDLTGSPKKMPTDVTTFHNYYSIGKDPLRYKTWLKAIGRSPDEDLKPKNVICSRHFAEEDFYDLQGKLVLKKEAVPKLDLPRNATKDLPGFQPPKQKISVPKGDAFDSWKKNLTSRICSLYIKASDKKQNGENRSLLRNANPHSEVVEAKPLSRPPLDISDDSDDENLTEIGNNVEKPEKLTEKLENSTEFQCRTCLQVSDTKSSFSLEEIVLGRSLKSIILQFIPEMVMPSFVNDSICQTCHGILKTFVHFLERCVEVEGTLKKLVDAVEESDEACEIEHSDSDTLSLPPCDSSGESEPECDPPKRPKEENLELGENSIEISDDELMEENDELTTEKAVTDSKVNGSLKNSASTPTAQSRAGPLLGFTIKPHMRIISTHAPKNLDLMMRTLHANGVNIIDIKAKDAPAAPGGKRVLLLGNPSMYCPKCRLHFRRTVDLQMHSVSCHTKVPRRSRSSKGAHDPINFCPICEKNHESGTELRKHLRKEHRTIYQCSRCGKTFRQKISYDKHVEMFKDLDSCSYRKCRLCTLLVSHEEYFEHMKLHRTIKCEECGRTFLSPAHLDLHKVHHRKAKKEGHLCPYCGKLFNASSNMHAHIKRHTELATGDRHVCELCNKVFVTSFRLKMHVVRVHVKRGAFQCDKCGKVCVTNQTLRAHQQLKHASSNPLVCNICGKQFSRGDYYKRHMRWHIRAHLEQPYRGRAIYKRDPGWVKCKYCKRDYQNVYLLRSHIMASHMRNLRYKCRLCNVTLANPGSRLRHEKRHQDPNFDLTCKICWKRWDSKESLAAHAEVHKTNKRYTCSQCGESLPSKYHYLNHMSQKHITEEQLKQEKEATLKEALQEFMISK